VTSIITPAHHRLAILQLAYGPLRPAPNLPQRQAMRVGNDEPVAIG
jgi:hypothetical protein